ncbi:transcriptional regulator [Halovivax gelatinilyticus]|uniref:HVO_A0114 family putative DNA-binding protein n=1 Tax=Halovivax gelatinilyticus TaxID=2961597 RepID=UPI0020CA97D6|nr:transcriptional regulator [Halovivax gelatinilyticus]
MPDEPNTNTPETTDGEHTDSTDKAIAMHDIEAEAGFLEDHDPKDFPAVVQLTSEPEAVHRQNAVDRIERWEAGEEVPHVINFQNPSDLRALLTDRRIELLRSIMAERPDSIRQLAERVGRDVKSIHDDLQLLAEYDIVHFEQAGRAKRPFVPYETIEVSLEISTPRPADSESLV